jgi:hypothetical protein
MKELALHLLDIAENSVSARAKNIVIAIDEDLAADRLTLRVQDDGKGMSEETVRQVTDPFVTSRTTRKVGLGLPLLKAAAEMSKGGMLIQSRLGKGTTVTVDFQHTHIDRMPLGDVAGLMLTLVVGHPEIHWRLEYSGVTGAGARLEPFIFDDAEVKEALGDPDLLTNPDVLAFLRTSLEDGVNNIRKTLIPSLSANFRLG